MKIPDWKVQELIALVRRRYPDWQSMSHLAFVEEEVAYKRATIAKAQELISQPELDNLLANGRFELIIERLDKLGRDNNLLWRVVPSSGDTAVLYHPTLDTPDFCTQVRNLLYGDRPSPRRLQTFSQYLNKHNLPNKWTFATYFLFLCHPDKEIFIKPRSARWFLKFMQLGDPESPPMSTKILITMEPSSGSYETLLQDANALLTALEPHGAKDMVDIQSFIWVCEQESRSGTGRLDAKGQVELNIPAPNPYVPVSYAIAQPQTAVIQETNRVHESYQLNREYSLPELANETGYDEKTLQQWIDAIHRKGQAIFYGPSGTGKTYIAQKLACYLTAQGDGFQELVQFHPAYAYEDFVQGIRPFTDNDGNLHYALQNGRFLQFCQNASQYEGTCVLIIDEINRANLASVFGELMYLLEYRSTEIPLAAGGTFSIPANVRIIGTMNTADRSIALVDHALRRRFAFINMPPNMDILRHYHQNNDFDPEPLINILNQINTQIDDPHFALGIAYFLSPKIADTLPAIWRMEIEPYLEEYFYDRPEQVATFRWEQVNQMLNL